MRNDSPFTLSRLLLLLTVSAIPLASGEAKPSFAVNPAPAWTTKGVTAQPKSAASDLPTTILLDNEEIRLSANGVESFHHLSQRIDKSSGLEDASQLRFHFEPSYQRLAIHFIRIIRDNQTIDAFKPSEIKLVQTEDELDSQLYNGTLVAVAFLNDIRVGDIVEYAFTVTGANPVFGGRFARSFRLASDQPIQLSRVRLLAPADRVLQFRGHGAEFEPQIRSLGGEKEYLWEATDVPALTFEDSTPSWFDLPFFSVSEFSDWRAVAQWALPMYGADGPLTAELLAKIKAWNELAQPEQRVTAALRFVQQEIRYQGIELGEYSHRPNPATRTLTRRFGDCKDKSLLLATILKHLGIDSAIALVSSETRRSLDDWQATPTAFDHAIVQSRTGGKTYWLDPTLNSQRGTIAAYYDPPYERALVLREDTSGLDTIPSFKAESPTTVIHERYVVKDQFSPVSLVVTSTYSGPDADDKRYDVSDMSAAELGRFFLNYYASANPSIRADGPPEISDDQDSNTIVITERYTIDSFWTDQYHYFDGHLVYSQLSKPEISKRSHPLAIPFPNFTTQTIEIDLPDSPKIAETFQVIANRAIRFEYSHETSGKVVRLIYSLRTLKDSLPSEEVADYLGQVDRIRNSTGLHLPAGSAVIVRSGRQAQAAGVGLAFALLVVVGLAIGGFLLINRYRNKRTRASWIASPAPGVTPQTAVRCPHQADVENFVKSFRCACGNLPYTPSTLGREEYLRYDGERIALIRLSCERCGQPNDLYFVTTNEPGIDASSASESLS